MSCGRPMLHERTQAPGLGRRRRPTAQGRGGGGGSFELGWLWPWRKAALRRGDVPIEAGANHGDRECGTLKARRRPWIGREEVEQGAREKDGIGQRGAGGKEMGSWERWIGLSVPWRREETRSGIVGEREVANEALWWRR